ncbi:MAG: adenylate/guanylate cyclase domain-containing protein, partial [Desulfobacteraceae bacterium]|nr:adenylate/guanylate cyclase domain-containing protein [Desulfobacteraceae bacterium]
MITNKRQHIQITILLIVGAYLTAHICFWLLPNLFEMWDAKAIDRLFLFRSSSSYFQPKYDGTIVHVDISDTSLKRLKTFYLDRSHYARVMRNLAKMDVSAQMYDFIFAARSDQVEDRALINATKEAGNVYFGMAFNLEKKGGQKSQQLKRDSKEVAYLELTEWNVVVDGDPNDLYEGVKPVITFPELASVSKGLGYLNITTDPDGVNRRIPLLVKYKGAFYPSFAFRGICDYLHVTPGKIIIRPGKSITLKDAKRPGESSGHSIMIPIDRHGNILINFIGTWERMKHYNFADLFYASDDRDEMEMWRDELSGKIVMVSEVLTGSSDLGPVPTDANFLSSGLHANIMHTILQESFLRELSGPQEMMIEVILLIILFVLSLRFSSLYFTLGAISVAAFYIATVGAGFLYGNLIFPVFQPLLMLVFAIIFIVIYRFIREERERHFIRATFGRYLSKEVVEELLGSPEGLKMSGESRQVTFLVSDLRGFTSISSRLSPHEIINILNNYFERMVEIISRYRGTVDELQGDGILVFFGAPLSASDDPERAIACAIEMQNAMSGINAVQRQKNLPELSMGIGINTGEVVVGNIGSEKRTKYGAVGSPINATYRIESHTIGGQILISPSTYHKIQSHVLIQDTMEVRFKGIDQAVTLYDVNGIKGKYEVSLSEKAPEEFRSLDVLLAITCFVLEGKEVSERAIPGHITGLSPFGAK